MNRFFKLLLLAAMLVCAALSIAEDQPGWIGKFNRWCCTKLGYGCGSSKLTTSRGNDQPRPKGGDLMTLNLESHEAGVLWKDCACWSPVPAGPGRLMVLSNGGIWSVPLDKAKERHLVFTADDVLELLGPGLSSDHAIWFLRSSRTPGCKFESWMLPLGGSAPVKASLSPELACGAEFDFQGIIKPAQVSPSGRGTLGTLFHHGKFEIVLEVNETPKLLFPDKPGDEVDRFDAIWTGPSSIVFVANQ